MSADNYLYVWRGRDSYFYVDMLFMSPEYSDERMWRMEDNIKADPDGHRYATAIGAITAAMEWERKEYILEYGVSTGPGVLEAVQAEGGHVTGGWHG